MKPAPFEYFCPATLDEAMSLLARHGGDAKPLAGGQSLIPALNFRLAAPAVLVDLNALPDLARVTVGDHDIRIGGMTRHRTLETSAVITREMPLVAQAMPFVAHAAIRTRGTLGGSLAHADPAAELPALMLALEAHIKVQSTRRMRTLPAADFFTGLFSTAIEPDEVLTEVVVPRAPGPRGHAFEEISRRRGDFALAGAAALVETDGAGVCRMARVALLSVADRPVVAGQVSRALVGQRPSPSLFRDAAEAAAADDIDPPGDIHASSRYRRHLAAVLIRRVLERAFHSLEPA